jgi:hypothetical protein
MIINRVCLELSLLSNKLVLSRLTLPNLFRARFSLVSLLLSLWVGFCCISRFVGLVVLLGQVFMEKNHG